MNTNLNDSKFLRFLTWNYGGKKQVEHFSRAGGEKNTVNHEIISGKTTFQEWGANKHIPRWKKTKMICCWQIYP